MAAEMLFQAAELTLDLAERLPAHELGLKDATPYNVLFRGPEPVFIDVLSFERRESGDPAWLPYAQFIRTFLLPLLAHKHLGLSLDHLSWRSATASNPKRCIAGRTAPEMASSVSDFRSLPTWLGRRHKPDDAAIYRRRLLADHEKAAFILQSLFKGLRRTLAKLRPATGRRSTWSGYLVSNCQYSPLHFEAKRDFVQCLPTFRPGACWMWAAIQGYSACAPRAPGLRWWPSIPIRWWWERRGAWPTGRASPYFRWW